ncbi:hypothetical protein CMI44_01350, partial [Candidatus Pacearchaeota archaeon]|nr:hypothetical protein [Candidatus Pacearchaeota archaeon]
MLIVFSIFYLINFYSVNQDFVHKDISLTGGTSVTLIGDIDSTKLEQGLGVKLEDFNIRGVSDLITQERKALIIETKLSSDETKQILEEYLGYELTPENSSFEFTGSTLSESFYRQLLTAVWVAFVLMSLVVFLIFGESQVLKTYVAVLSLFIVKTAYSHISLVNALAIFLILLSIPFLFYYSMKKKINYYIPVAFSIAVLFLLI